MKRLFVLSLVTVLSVGLLSVGVLAQPAPAEESENTYVEWTIDAPMQCALTIDAHAGINLGTLNSVQQWFTASGSDFGSSARRVVTESNCEYNLNVEVTGITAPVGNGEFLNDFALTLLSRTNVNSVTGNFNNNNNPSSWYNFSSVGDSPKIGEAGDNNYGNSIESHWDMDYAYYTDYTDSNDYYRVDLQYTASTT